MDGLDTSDPDEPVILVATTAQDVRRNLVTNLQSHKNQSGNIGSRHVVVATSQPATGAVHERLRESAFQEGFQLVNVHGRQAFADLLYRSPHWTNELLGLIGNLAALSAVPLSSRPMSNLPTIGRQAEVQWLADSSGDIVISGNPASGKTHLLRQFVDQGWLFMADAARDRLSAAVNDLNPEAIVVDDAHANPRDIHRLQQLRSELGSAFRIVAVTWPGDVNTVTSALAVSSGSVLELRPLDRSDIMEVIKAAGIKKWVGVQKEIIDQSAGLPGLATTLCNLAIRGDLTGLFSGELLLREIRTMVTQVAGDTGMQILAVMALAGESGASLKDVHDILGLSISESHALLTRLGHTGVFRTSSLGDKTTIWPRELRFTAVGSYFFSDKPHENLPLEVSLDYLDERNIIGSLLGAAVLGANIPPVTIEPMLLRVGSDRDFAHYAEVGRQESKFALTARPQWLTQIAPYSLLTNPEETLPRLLKKAAEQRETSTYETDPPMEIIKRWIESAPRERNEQTKRRKLVAAMTTRFAVRYGDLQVVLEALCLAMNPEIHPV